MGQTFEGMQRVSRLDSSPDENWPVEIRIQDVNLEDGLLWGSSTWHLPNGKSPVITAWEGEIIDNVNHNFVTSKWGATQQSDMKFWSKFGQFGPLRHNVLQKRGRCGYLRDYSHIYMRWKEQCFLNTGEDCGLTIAGFYYICMSRRTGEVHGIYVDPQSTPNHHLSLRPCTPGVPGSQTFSAFQYR
ncbi:probable glucose-induced degradation protein 4 homolog [Coccomyxa sp. Obi]|nr:probable glucose-induced degradation protein 4 homolog [Coccomyxa sp. Obi]